MDFTGERYVPEITDAQISYEHWHRYLYATTLVSDQVALDLGSGEGYGAHILALHAREVVGVDIDVQSVQHAWSRYQRRNLLWELEAGTPRFDEFRLALTQAGFRPSDDPKPFEYVVAVCGDGQLRRSPAQSWSTFRSSS